MDLPSKIILILGIVFIVALALFLLGIELRNNAYRKKFPPGSGKVTRSIVGTIPGFSEDISDFEILKNAGIGACKFYRILGVYDAGGMNWTKYTRYEIEYWD